MKTSQTGLDLIKKWEGCFLTAYHGAADRPGLLTIGYGHTDAAGPPKVTAGKTITKQEAEDILRRDLVAVENDVLSVVKVPLTQNQFDVLVSFTFNLGKGNLEKSTLLKRINKGDYNVSNEFSKWTKANGVFVQGLANRRADEAKLWSSVANTMPPTSPQKPVDASVEVPRYSPSSLFSSIIKFIISLFKGK